MLSANLQPHPLPSPAHEAPSGVDVTSSLRVILCRMRPLPVSDISDRSFVYTNSRNLSVHLHATVVRTAALPGDPNSTIRAQVGAIVLHRRTRPPRPLPQSVVLPTSPLVLQSGLRAVVPCTSEVLLRNQCYSRPTRVQQRPAPALLLPPPESLPLAANHLASAPLVRTTPCQRRLGLLQAQTCLPVARSHLPALRFSIQGAVFTWTRRSPLRRR